MTALPPPGRYRVVQDELEVVKRLADAQVPSQPNHFTLEVVDRDNSRLTVTFPIRSTDRDATSLLIVGLTESEAPVNLLLQQEDGVLTAYLNYPE